MDQDLFKSGREERYVPLDAHHHRRPSCHEDQSPPDSTCQSSKGRSGSGRLSTGPGPEAAGKWRGRRAHLKNPVARNAFLFVNAQRREDSVSQRARHSFWGKKLAEFEGAGPKSKVPPLRPTPGATSTRPPKRSSSSSPRSHPHAHLSSPAHKTRSRRKAKERWIDVQVVAVVELGGITSISTHGHQRRQRSGNVLGFRHLDAGPRR